jgi:glutamyl-tRNA reductase
MTRRIAESLPGEGLLFVNRTLAHAEALAATHGANAMSLRAFVDAPPAVRAVVSATGAPTAILSFPTLRALAAAPHPPILLDLAVPPDIDPGAAAALGLIRWDMDTINAEAARNSARRAEQGVEAREMIDAALDDVSSKATARALSPLLAELYTVYKETADRAVDRVMARDLAGLPPETRDAVSRFGQDLARRLAHLPASGLRALATEGGMEPVRAFLTSPNDPMTQRLSRVARQSDEGAD